MYQKIEPILATLHVLLPRTHNKFGERSFSAAGPRLWNDLPPGLRWPMYLSIYGESKYNILYQLLDAFRAQNVPIAYNSPEPSEWLCRVCHPRTHLFFFAPGMINSLLTLNALWLSYLEVYMLHYITCSPCDDTFFFSQNILPRCMKCRRGLPTRILSVRPSVLLSVCLSNACIATKRNKDLSRFLYHTKEHLE